MKIAAANAENDEDEKDEKGMQECPKCGHKFKSKKSEAMDATTQKLVELEYITAEQAEAADEGFVVRAVASLHENLKAVQAANARLESENTALQAKVKDVEKAEAQTVIQAAIAEGKIGVKDQTSIDFYLASFVASPETTKKVLAAMPKNPVLQKVIDVKVSDTKRVAQGQSEADLREAQHLAVHEVQASHPDLSYQDAFNKARRDKPDIFPLET